MQFLGKSGKICMLPPPPPWGWRPLLRGSCIRPLFRFVNWPLICFCNFTHKSHRGSPMTSYRGNPRLGVLKGYGQKVTGGWLPTNDLNDQGSPMTSYGRIPGFGGTEGLRAEIHGWVVAHKWWSDRGSPMTSYQGKPGLGILKGYGQKVAGGWLLTSDEVIGDPLWHHTGGIQGWGYWRVMGRKSRVGSHRRVVAQQGMFFHPLDLI